MRFFNVLLIAAMLMIAGSAVAQDNTYMFFSEYVEGSSNNKALEIYNNTSDPIDMARVTIERYNNGAVTPSGTFNTFTGILAPQDVYVIANPSADPAILAVADFSTGATTYYNGDDVLMLYLDGELVDVIGILGEDPGSNWGTSPCTTNEATLVRKINVCAGDIIADDPFDPATEWDCYAQNIFDFLGQHASNCSPVGNESQTWGTTKALYR